MQWRKPKLIPGRSSNRSLKPKVEVMPSVSKEEEMESEPVGLEPKVEDEKLDEEPMSSCVEEGGTPEDAERSIEKKKAKKEVYVPGKSRPLKEGEVLEFDESAYRMFHRFRTTYPCLSFDCLRASANSVVESYPLTFYMVAGTQTEVVKQNSVVLFKLKNMGELIHEDSSDDENSYLSSDEETNNEAADKPMLTFVNIPHRGGINRIKVFIAIPLSRLRGVIVFRCMNYDGVIVLNNGCTSFFFRVFDQDGPF
ncbi:unnamed protein product [Soboliphyme baturini]|uniref:CAF1C_H4-bd domain-containing protein n=1 Tax=Soboliphyme baturini TaxID=241478 RepID=A0A183J9H6_9BILA|nr:unnamed protein product [Soboliphyme baturini]